MSHIVNITRIKAVYNALGNWKDKVVFTGGAVISLYADSATAVEVRPTEDVDIVVEITARSDYARLEEQLRAMGFQPDPDSHFIGRYLLPGLVVDVMPLHEDVLGFSNKWYVEGFETAINYTIDDLHTVRIFTPPCFIAAKLEAFKNRGGNDGRVSSDFEDIVFVLENRQAIWQEMKETDEPLKSFLADAFTMLCNNPYIEEWLSAHTSFAAQTAATILEEMKTYAKG